MKALTHGGKRTGAGRKQEAGSKLIRVPLELLPVIDQLKAFRVKQKDVDNDDFRESIYKEIINTLEINSKSASIIIMSALKKQNLISEPSLELKDSIAIAETGGNKVSEFAIKVEQRVETGELTHQQARKLIIQHHCG